MKLYWCPKTRSQRVVWMLEELGRPYERVLIDIRDTEAVRPASFQEASPMGKVPALEDGDVRMSESAAICLYLADRYAMGRLAPPLDGAERGRYLYWMLYTPAVVEPAMAEKFRDLEGSRFSSGWGDYPTMIATLESGLAERSWILGEEFSAADVLLGSSVVFMRQFGVLPETPALNAYADRCLDRPGFQTARALDSD